jgi:hypothetical protein
MTVLLAPTSAPNVQSGVSVSRNFWAGSKCKVTPRPPGAGGRCVGLSGAGGTYFLFLGHFGHDQGLERLADQLTHYAGAVPD